ncbi:hypothetical protein [Bradyrhizobium sp.]|uniref:hypothetical protein n=1 Tax=Bradyrhizobium sp. TaxID=376 RepID=UPI0025BB73E1|nr:hypothetical protein [Bradyrhizobium sp.]
MTRLAGAFRAKKTAPGLEAVKIRLLSVDNNRSAIVIDISVVIALPNDDGLVVVPMITIADDVTVAVPVTISVALTNRYTNGADANPPLHPLQQALRRKFQPRRRSLRHT